MSYFQKIFDEKDKDLNEAKKCIKHLEKRVNNLEERLDATDSYERRDTLVISGHVPVAHERENCNMIVRNMLKEIHINVPENEISTAHRLGKKPAYGKEDKRNIIFKLCRRDIKREILDACRQQKPRYYINESLTPTRSAIMYVLRKAKQLHPDIIGSTKSFDGNVQVWLPTSTIASASNSSPKYNRTTINTKEKLEELLQSKLSCSWNKFIERWPENIN